MAKQKYLRPSDFLPRDKRHWTSQDQNLYDFIYGFGIKSCYAGNRRITELRYISGRTIRRSIKKLERAGEIIVARPSGFTRSMWASRHPTVRTTRVLFFRNGKLENPFYLPPKKRKKGAVKMATPPGQNGHPILKEHSSSVVPTEEEECLRRHHLAEVPKAESPKTGDDFLPSSAGGLCGSGESGSSETSAPKPQPKKSRDIDQLKAERSGSPTTPKPIAERDDDELNAQQLYERCLSQCGDRQLAKELTLVKFPNADLEDWS